MATPTVSDQEFINLWRQLLSPQKVADEIGVGVRRVFTRRRNIEKKYDIRLPIEAELLVDSREIVHLNMGTGVVLIGSDIHRWPGQFTTMQRAFIDAMQNWSRYSRNGDSIAAAILNGDVFDGATISRHPTIGWEKRPTVEEELEAVKQFLDPLEAALVGKYRVWNLGNHDMRYETRLANQAPEYRGVKGIHLKDHFPNWTPAWRCDINDDIVVRHREFGGEHADWNNVVKGGKTVVTGHDHRTGVVPYRDYSGLRYGVRTGFMGDSPLDPQYIHYLEAREPNWHPAFAVLTFKDGLLLYPELCTRVEEGVVQFRGELIRV